MAKRNDNDDDDDDSDDHAAQTLQEKKEHAAVVKEEEDGDPSTSKQKRKRKRKRKQPSTTNEHDDNKNDDDNNKNNNSSDPIASLDRTVYVEGIPFDCTYDDVRDFFVTTLQLTGNVTELRLPQWQDSGRLRGFGHVVLDTIESRNQAIASSGKHYLKNRYVTIQPAKTPTAGNENVVSSTTTTTPRPQPEHCRTIFCRNLPYSATADELEQLFRPCGKIVEGGVRIAYNYQTKQSKGFCYIEFKHPEGAFAAVTRKEPFVLQGRVCQIDYDEGTIKGSYKTETGRLWRREYHQPQQHHPTPVSSTRTKHDNNKGSGDNKSGTKKRKKDKF